MLLQLPVQLRVIRHVAQKCLTLAPLEVEVAVEVRGQLHSGIILEVGVQDLYHCLEGLRFLCCLQVKVLQQPPGSSSHASDDVQEGLTRSL